MESVQNVAFVCILLLFKFSEQMKPLSIIRNKLIVLFLIKLKIHISRLSLSNFVLIDNSWIISCYARFKTIGGQSKQNN